MRNILDTLGSSTDDPPARLVILLVGLLFTLALLCPQAMAASNHVGEMSIRQGDWLYKPVYSARESGQPAAVRAIAALRDQSQSIGQTLDVVLFQRLPSGSEWSAKSWNSGTLPEAIKAIKVEYAISDCEDWLWEVATDFDIKLAEPAEDAEAFIKGILSGDPLQGILPQGEFREVVVRYLEANGYKAASVPIENVSEPGTLSRDFTLSQIELAFHVYLNTDGSEQAKELAAAAVVSSMPADPPGQQDVPGFGNRCLLIWTWPPQAYGLEVCGNWTTERRTTQSPFGISSVAETCFFRNCATLQRSTTMMSNICVRPPTVPIGYLYRSVTSVEGCCLSGNAGDAPPVPCTPKKDDWVTNSWSPTIPTVPGAAPGGGPTWPVQTPRCTPPR